MCGDLFWVKAVQLPALLLICDGVPCILLQSIVRGSFVGHGDYISHVIAQMSRLSVSSSNSLRRSSPSTAARRRAQSMGRLGELGELGEEQHYQYQALEEQKTANGSTYWQDRIQQARGSGGLQRAKSTCHMGELWETPSPDMPTSNLYAQSEGAELRRPRPLSKPRRPPGDRDDGTKPSPHLPDVLSSSKKQTPRRPHSSYDMKVWGLAWLSIGHAGFKKELALTQSSNIRNRKPNITPET